MDGLAQHVRAVSAHKCSDLDAIDDGVEPGTDIGLSADGVDAGIRAATVGQVLDPVVDIFLLEIERHCTGRFGESQPLGHRVDGDDVSIGVQIWL